MKFINKVSKWTYKGKKKKLKVYLNSALYNIKHSAKDGNNQTHFSCIDEDYKQIYEFIIKELTNQGFYVEIEESKQRKRLLIKWN